MKQKIYLQLEDGSIYEGYSFGAPLTENVIAEVVFTTAMTGYVETLTDPSYYGQMLVQTFPLIGNYGVHPADFESSKIHMSAYIVHEYCNAPSNFRNQFDLDSLLKRNNIPGICNIDTRSLTKRIRSKGVMVGCLCNSPISSEEVASLSHWKIDHAVSHVTSSQISRISTSLPKHHVVLWDFGAKENIVRSLTQRDCDVTTVPASSTCEEILALHPDGILLSNGPGNPKDNSSIIKELQKLCQAHIPTFGICLGHQLLALANRGDTEKLKYGHRGSNQPVKDMETGRTYITSQNHGYAVKNDCLPANSDLYFKNVNDDTCEGIRYHSFPGFSVQFHPEACGGPHDTEYLFQEFIHLMEGAKSSCH
ncbi:MAG: carbamoyl phosphate synthase small subunit [Lachnospiraceae bacterium]